MKKIVSLIIASQLLATAAFADVSYVKTNRDYDWGKDTVTLAARADDKSVIPFSIGDYDGEYAYAYTPDNAEIEITEVQPVKFTDVDDYNFAVDNMSARGVMTGNGDGTFQPDRVLTRAEMAAVFARLYGVETSNDTPVFSDVAPDSWYAPYVMGLYKEGIFMADDKFNPDSEITREQLTAMQYRMLTGIKAKSAEIPDDFKFDEQYVDYDTVSDFAKPAYKYLKVNSYMLIDDCEENDPMDFADDKYYFKPQQGVTRQECAENLYYTIRDYFISNSPAILREDAPSSEIPVLDGSTSTYPITENIYRGYYYNSENCEARPAKHSKTSNSYKRLIDGEVEMIFVPDPSEEITKYAEEKGVKLKFIPIATEALVFFNDKANKVSDITTKQLHDIYVDNSIKSWSELGGDDKELAAFCRNNDSGSHAQMEKFILDGAEINEEISKERISVMMASILTDVESYNFNHTDSSAMGYSLFYYFNSAKMVVGGDDLKLMSINGVAPTDETIADGTYPFATFYYAVVRDEENEKVDKFIELMKSDFGKSVIELSGYGVVK